MNVNLRAPEPEDLALCYRLENDETLWSVGAARTHFSRYALKQYLAAGAQDIFQAGELRLVIKEPESGTAVGLIDLTSYSAMDERAEVGIALLPEYRHRGLGTAALRALEHYAGNILHIRLLYAMVSTAGSPANPQFFTQAGYNRVATLPAWHYYDGKSHDIQVFQKML